LIELLVVIAIIAILAALLLPVFEQSQRPGARSHLFERRQADDDGRAPLHER
jgi:type II secretory pathway pseudopilin PulG